MGKSRSVKSRVLPARRNTNKKGKVGIPGVSKKINSVYYLAII